MIDIDWFKHSTKKEYPSFPADTNLPKIIQSWVIPSGDNKEEMGEWAACSTWRLIEPTYNNLAIILESLYFKLGESYPIERAKLLALDCANTEGPQSYREHAPSIILLEDTHALSSFNPILHDMRIKGIMAERFDAQRHGNTLENRLELIKPLLQEGKVWIINKDNNELRSQDATLIKYCRMVPGKEGYVVVSSMVNVLLYLKRYGLKTKLDEDMPQQQTGPRHTFYGPG